MKAIKFLTIIRVLAAIILCVSFGHQAEGALGTLEVNGYSIGYLATLFAFYLILYLIRFYINIKKSRNWIRKNKVINRIQVLLVLLALLLTVAGAKIDVRAMSLMDEVKLLLKAASVLLADLIFFVLEIIYHFFKDENDCA